MRLKPGGGIDRQRLDLLRRVVGDLFDVHAPFGRGDDSDAAGLAVDQHREAATALDLVECGSCLVLDEGDARVNVAGHPVERGGTCVHGLLLSGTGQCPIRHRRFVPAYSHRRKDARAACSSASASRSFEAERMLC